MRSKSGELAKADQTATVKTVKRKVGYGSKDSVEQTRKRVKELTLEDVAAEPMVE